MHMADKHYYVYNIVHFIVSLNTAALIKMSTLSEPELFRLPSTVQIT
jgi:hypothetical protein